MSRRHSRFRFRKALPVPLNANELDIGWATTKSHLVRGLKEQKLLSKTTDFMPTLPVEQRLDIRSVLQAAPAFTQSYLTALEQQRLFTDNAEVVVEHETFDPLRGNSLAMIDHYLSGHVITLFSAGPSLSTLVITTSEKKPFRTQAATHRKTVNLPFDTYKAIKCIDFEYPIRQIALSPFTTLPERSFIVRTTSSLYMFELFRVKDKDDKITIDVKQVYHTMLAERTETHNDKIDYSQPVHVEMSPYEPSQFLFTTNNGYTALIDSSTDTTVYDWMLPLSDVLETNTVNTAETYTARWTVCTFGVSTTRFFAATHEDVTEWAAKDSGVRCKRIFYTTKSAEEQGLKKRSVKKDYVAALATCRQSTNGQPLLCFTTGEFVVVMNVDVPLKPVLAVPHKIVDSPCVLTLEEVDKNKHDFRLTVSSHMSQRLTLIDFHFNAGPSRRGPRPDFHYNGIYYLKLDQLPVREINYRTSSYYSSVGLAVVPTQYRHIDRKDTSNNDDARQHRVHEFLSVYRLFEDGSIRVKHFDFVDLDKPQLNETEAKVALLKSPRYALMKGTKAGAQLKKLLDDAKLAVLPEIKGRLFTDVELMDLNMLRFMKDLKKFFFVYKSHTALTRLQKAKMISKLEKLQHVALFRELVEDAFQRPDLDSMLDFLQQLENRDDVNITVREPNLVLDIPAGVEQEGQDGSKDILAYDTYKKERIISDILIQRKDLQDADLTTDTARFFDHEWQEDDDTNYNEIPFPDVEESTLPRQKMVQFDVDADDTEGTRPMKRMRAGNSSLDTAGYEQHAEEEQLLPTVAAAISSAPPIVVTPVEFSSSVPTITEDGSAQTPADSRFKLSAPAGASRKATITTKKKKKAKVSGFR